MTDIVVKFSALVKASEDIGKAISNMNSELDALEKGIQPLLSTWDGQAKDAYYARQAEWTSASKDLTQLLTQIKGAVSQSAEIMQAREKANMQKFGG
jgi:WXG100 family type VII secretion target